MLVDAHCHLGDAAFDPDRDEVVARARAAGVGHVVVIGASLEDSERAVALARATPGLSATVGVHPHDAASWSEATRERLRALGALSEVVAVGETGLDYHYQHAPPAAQRRAFEAQLELAQDLGKAVVVHARAADDDMAALLAATGSRNGAIVLHSFTSGARVFAAGMAVGAYFSFSGMITFKNWQPETPLAACPAERLLVETDAPYLAPVPHRGRRNEPAFVREVAAALARSRGVSLDEVARLTTANARRAFGPRVGAAL